ncbi:hypothetical protein CPB86DRAFT_873174 [Serendipita vermifera]|nr:hypothetical protein CPB86DRAFT_873174 [Serendipita vermifera]
MPRKVVRKALRLSNIPTGICLNLIRKDISRFLADVAGQDQLPDVHQSEEDQESTTIRLGEVMGYGQRCAKVRILGDGPQASRNAISKFFEIEKPSHKLSLSQELRVYSDIRLTRYQLSTTAPVESQEDGWPCMPRLIGLFGPENTENAQQIISSDGIDRDLQTTYVLLVEELPEQYRPLHKLRDVLPEYNLPSPPPGLFVAACTALRRLHLSGYIHGDISRGNFLCTLEETQDQEGVFIIDFEKSRYPQDFSFSMAVKGEMSSLFRLFVEHGFRKDELTPLYNAQVAQTLLLLSDENGPSNEQIG